MPETELPVLANVYRHVLESANKNAAGVSSTNGDDAKLRNTKGGSYVDQRPD
jgi:hypothetical protein